MDFFFLFFIFFIIIFFEKNLEILNFFWRNWKFWLMIFFFFLKQPKKYKPNAPSPKAFFENFLLLFFFFFEIWRFVHYQKSEEDEDEDGVKVWRFIHDDFFFEKSILWMRITLAGSWCGLLDKSLLNSCKKIISISNGFIHWNELEVLTQCP